MRLVKTTVLLTHTSIFIFCIFLNAPWSVSPVCIFWFSSFTFFPCQQPFCHLILFESLKKN